MKTFAAIILLLITISLSAQVPNYFENNPQWRQNSSCRTGDCVDTEDYVYYLNGDSIIENTTYHKIYKHGIVHHYWYFNPPVPDWCIGSSTFNEFYALVRQEENRVYIRQWNEPEALLYDYGLQVGDTLPITWNQMNNDIVVLSIDSLKVGNSYRKVFNLTQQSSPQLIEGIGHEGGFLEPFPPIFDCGHNLFCYVMNDTTYYPSFNSPCDLTVNIKIIPSQEIIKYFPNPVVKDLTIEFGSSEKIQQVIAYNGVGKKNDLKFEAIGGNEVKIDMSRLGKGLYIIQLKESGYTLAELKVIKE